MKKDEQVIYMSDHLDEFDYYLVWQMDEIILISFGVLIGLIFRQPLFGFVFGYAVRTVYVKVRDGKPHGYILHRARELGFLPSQKNQKNAHPPSLVEEYKQ